MEKKREHIGRAAVYAVLLTLLLAVCELAACGQNEQQKDGLVPMETAKSYEHVAKAEDREPTPSVGGGIPDPGTPSTPDVTGTVTPAATVTPKPDDAAGDEDIVYVAVSKLNLRAEPSLESEIVGQAKYGDAFVRTEKGTQGWDKLIYNGQEVYAYAEYLSEQKVAGMKDSISVQYAADAKKK